MWFYYNCPECQRPISTYDTQDNEYIYPKIMQETKEHYVQNHGMDKLLLTDDELLYDIKSKKLTSEAEPTW
jgi:hypothetical protein